MPIKKILTPYVVNLLLPFPDEYDDPEYKQSNNNLYLPDKDAAEQFLKDYSKDKVNAVMHAALFVFDQIQKQLGSIDFRVVFSAANITFTALMKYAKNRGKPEMTDEETQQLTAVTFKTYLQLHKGEYDAPKLQAYLKDLNRKMSNAAPAQAIKQPSAPGGLLSVGGA